MIDEMDAKRAHANLLIEQVGLPPIEMENGQKLGDQQH
jgi:hypothetical protein